MKVGATDIIIIRSQKLLCTLTEVLSKQPCYVPVCECTQLCHASCMWNRIQGSLPPLMTHTHTHLSLTYYTTPHHTTHHTLITQPHSDCHSPGNAQPHPDTPRAAPESPSSENTQRNHKHTAQCIKHCLFSFIKKTPILTTQHRTRRV